MSTILKALEKVEEEERLGHSPGAAEPDPPTQAGALQEPAPKEGRQLPWRGALAGAAVVTLTMGMVWLWSPEQAGNEPARTAPSEAREPARAASEPGALRTPARAASGPAEAVAVVTDPVASAAAPLRDDPAELVAPGSNDADAVDETLAARLAETVPEQPPSSTDAAPPAAESPPLAVAAEIQPKADEPARSPASSVRSATPPPAPPPAKRQVASRPAALPVDPPPVQPDPKPVAPPPVQPAPKPAAPPPVQPDARLVASPPVQPDPKPVTPLPGPRPSRVATIPPAPTVHVARTVWHPSPDRRSARVEVEGFIEPLDLKEGDAVGVLVVAEIQPSAVVFLHGGARLRRAVGK